jgi:polyhydroxyalkanoate synthesis repressor PhaR
MTLTIKRYPNRKLYDTEEKQYITLERISELIRDGVDLKVVDHASGEDLTAVTLTQIIFEQEKKQAGFLPKPLLTSLVKAGGETLDSVRRTLVKPLNLHAHLEDEITRRIEVLVAEGKFSAAEGETLRSLLLAVPEAHLERHESGIFERTVSRVLSDVGVPTRSEYEKLLAQLEILTEKIEEMQRDQKA